MITSLSTRLFVHIETKIDAEVAGRMADLSITSLHRLDHPDAKLNAFYNVSILIVTTSHRQPILPTVTFMLNKL